MEKVDRAWLRGHMAARDRRYALPTRDSRPLTYVRACVGQASTACPTSAFIANFHEIGKQ
jgi:hypothetical protein